MLTNGAEAAGKVLTGYNGNDDQLAMRRGEIAGTHRLAVVVRAVREERLRPLHRPDRRQGHRRAAAPRSASRIRTALSLIALVQSQGDIARLTAGPPGIPQAVLDALRDAYRKALEDKELQEKAAKLERPVEPGYGDDVLNAIVTALKQPPETVALLGPGVEERSKTPRDGVEISEYLRQAAPSAMRHGQGGAAKPREVVMSRISRLLVSGRRTRSVR